MRSAWRSSAGGRGADAGDCERRRLLITSNLKRGRVRAASERRLLRISTKYFDRGWCFTEASWASLTKSGAYSLDLGKMRDDKEYGFRSLVDDLEKVALLLVLVEMLEGVLCGQWGGAQPGQQ